MLIILSVAIQINGQLISIPTYQRDFTGILERNYNRLKFGGTDLEAELINYFLYLPEDREEETQTFNAHNLFVDWYFSLPDKIGMGFNFSSEFWDGHIDRYLNMEMHQIKYNNQFRADLNNVDIVIPRFTPFVRYIRVGKQWLNYSQYILNRVWGLTGVMAEGYPLPELKYQVFYTWHKYTDYYHPLTFYQGKVNYSNTDDEGTTSGGKVEFLWRGLWGIKFLQGAKLTGMGVNYNEELKEMGTIRNEDTYELDFEYSYWLFSFFIRNVNRIHIEYFENDGFGNIFQKTYKGRADEYKVSIRNLIVFDDVIFLWRKIDKDFIPWNPARWLRYPPYFSTDYLRDTPDRPLYTDEQGYTTYFHKEISPFVFSFRWDETHVISDDPYKYEFVWGNGIKKRDMFLFEISYYFLACSFIYQYKEENYYREKSEKYIKEELLLNYNTFRFVVNLSEKVKLNLGVVLQNGYFSPDIGNWDELQRVFLCKKYFTLFWALTKKSGLRVAGSFLNPNPPNKYTPLSGWREGPNFIMELNEWYGDYYDNFIRVGLFSKF